MDSTAPPESQPECETAAPPSNSIDELTLPANVLSEIDALLQGSPAPRVPSQDTPPGKRVRLLRETLWTMSLPPWHDMMLLTPVREPVNQRIVIIKEALNLKSFLDLRPRKRNAMLAQVVGVKATPQCEQCEHGKGQFVGCIVMPDMFEGACANCVWEKSRGQPGQCSFLVEKENLEDSLKHEEKMRKSGGHTFFGVWKLPKK